ncbi:hypothetical protein AB0I22_24585 [Streptomyces sp. NPDC050610]|uniref:hypothetical protein n=1 Tax=Streptomyces sp. NPDC050610 TaxID=3157097 RepID=UPI003416A19B
MTATNRTNATSRTDDAASRSDRTDRTDATSRTKKNAVRAAAASGALAGVLLGFVPAAQAAGTPAPPNAPAASAVAEAHQAATAPATLDTLSRFFARDSAAGGAVAKAKAAPKVEGATVPVYTLAPEFVAGKAKAPVAKLDFLATGAVSADGRKASVWAVRQGGSYKVVNIATGDDETRYAAAGAKKASGGTVFREPQIDAWYVQRGDRVLPLDADAERAVGAKGISVEAYQARVHKAYGDKLPGSAYAKKGLAGGYGADSSDKSDSGRSESATADSAKVGAPAVAQAASVGHGNDGLLTATSLATGGAAVVALGLSVMAARRRRRA